MPRRSESFRVSASNAAELAGHAREVSRTIARSMERSTRDVAKDAELVFQARAPKRTGRLARGIRAIPAGPDQVVVTASAVDPKSRYDYVAVTRFGHRKAFITPVRKSGALRKSRRVERSASGQFATRGGGKLVFQSRGRLWRLARVRGFRPKGDWVQKALPEIQVVADTEMAKMGNDITVSWR